jgi:hypothetical protein
MTHDEHVDVVVVEVRRGRDGKLYPPRMPLPQEERDRLRAIAHALRCRDGLSIREIQRTMRDSYGVRRSTGQIHADLRRFACTLCRDDG